MKNYLYILIATIFTACGIDTTKPVPNPYQYKVKVTFVPVYGNTNLSLNIPYITPLGESFTPTKLKWYCSNWQASKAGIQIAMQSNYFLTDASSNALTTEVYSSSAQISNLSFLLGVDSVRNVSGVQEGALDPLNGMFWTWNSGYIMFKLEGTSPQSTLVNNKVEYHIGGFTGINSALRTINFALANNQQLNINPSRPSEVTVNVDIEKLFNATHNISIATNASAHMPNTFSAKLADNYSKIFTVTNVTNY